MARRLLSPCLTQLRGFERPLCGHLPPTSPLTELGIAHRKLQTARELCLQSAARILKTQCPHDVRACALAVRKATGHTSKAVLVSRSACGASRSSTMIRSSTSISPRIDTAACHAPQFVQYASQSTAQKRRDSLGHFRHSWLGVRCSKHNTVKKTSQDDDCLSR